MKREATAFQSSADADAALAGAFAYPSGRSRLAPA
jgi:hypothetical protein